MRVNWEEPTITDNVATGIELELQRDGERRSDGALVVGMLLCACVSGSSVEVRLSSDGPPLFGDARGFSVPLASLLPAAALARVGTACGADAGELSSAATFVGGWGGVEGLVRRLGNKVVPGGFLVEGREVFCCREDVLRWEDLAASCGIVD